MSLKRTMHESRRLNWRLTGVLQSQLSRVVSNIEGIMMDTLYYSRYSFAHILPFFATRLST